MQLRSELAIVRLQIAKQGFNLGGHLIGGFARNGASFDLKSAPGALTI